jgi:hypothetical protein
VFKLHGKTLAEISTPTSPEDVRATRELLAGQNNVASSAIKVSFSRKPPSRRNPDAAALSEAWHGRPPRSARDVEEIEETPDELADLGGLEELWVIERDGRHARVIRFGHDVRLAATPDGQQLYLVGGDQSLDLDELGVPQAAQARELVEVGPVWKVVYVTDKAHAGAPTPAPFVHEFGGKNGEVPVLIYNRPNQRMLLAGGVYQIPVESDGLSPGIVD